MIHWKPGGAEGCRMGDTNRPWRTPAAVAVVVQTALVRVVGCRMQTVAAWGPRGPPDSWTLRSPWTPPLRCDPAARAPLNRPPFARARHLLVPTGTNDGPGTAATVGTRRSPSVTVHPRGSHPLASAPQADPRAGALAGPSAAAAEDHSMKPTGLVQDLHFGSHRRTAATS